MQQRVTLWLAVAIFLLAGVLAIGVMLARSLLVEGNLSRLWS